MPLLTQPIHEFNPNHEPSGSAKGGQFAAGKGPRLADNTERIPEYKDYATKILGASTEPMSEFQIVGKLKQAGFKAMRTSAGGYEDRYVAMAKALRALEAEGKVKGTETPQSDPTHAGAWIWQLTEPPQAGRGRQRYGIKATGDGQWHFVVGKEVIDTYPDKQTAQAARDHAVGVSFGLRNPKAAGRLAMGQGRRR